MGQRSRYVNDLFVDFNSLPVHTECVVVERDAHGRPDTHIRAPRITDLSAIPESSLPRHSGIMGT